MIGKTLLVSIAFCVCAGAEVHTMTLKKAVDRALGQNPDLTIAKLDLQTAEQQVRIAKDPFIPKVYVGSGLAATYGFPQTLDSGAPSLFQVHASSALLNRPRQHLLAQSKTETESAVLASETAEDRIVMRTVELYLQAERAAKTAGAVRQQLDGLRKVVELLKVQEAEGRLLPVEVKRAALDVARGMQRLEIHESDQAESERRLASVLAYPDGDRVRAATEQRPLPDLPDSADSAVGVALQDNTDVRRLETELRANGFAVRAEKANRYPKINLIGKYSLLSRFNNYEEFFNKFQRHNAQLGISMELPLFTGPAAKARLAQANIKDERLQTELRSKRSEIALEARRVFQEVRKAETAVSVARLELEVAREDLGVLLAQMEEGRASMKDVEALRYLENEKWISFYAANHTLELARYQLLNRTGGLLAALR